MVVSPLTDVHISDIQTKLKFLTDEQMVAMGPSNARAAATAVHAPGVIASLCAYFYWHVGGAYDA
jgi:hypothetical protein